MDVGNLISGSSAFSKSRLNIWKFMAHVFVKAGLEKFEHYFARVWDECNCALLWSFFGIAFLWDWGFPGGLEGKSVCLQCRRPGFDPWVRKIPWRWKGQPTPVLLPGKFHGWRSLAGYSPWDHKESDMTERPHTFFETGMKTDLSSRVATSEFSKFAGILSAAFSQHHLFGFGIAELEFHHLHYNFS